MYTGARNDIEANFQATYMSKKIPENLDVAQAFTELETIANWFERGGADLDAGLKKFERAMLLAEALKKRLNLAENTVKEIKKKYQAE